MSNTALIGSVLLDKMAGRLPTADRLAFEHGTFSGYLIVRPEQRDLQRLWTLWCIRQKWPDIRVEEDAGYSVVTMHLGPSQSTLSADGMNAIRRAFQRYADDGQYYQTHNWCKHPRVPVRTSTALASTLAEIAYLDGVPIAS